MRMYEKSYVAEAAVSAYRIVKPGTADDNVLTAAAVSDLLVGVIEGVAPALGERCDVVLAGPALCTLGGTVTRGAKLTADASGRAVAAAPAAGTNNQIIGWALVSGVVGDVVEIFVAPSVLQG